MGGRWSREGRWEIGWEGCRGTIVVNIVAIQQHVAVDVLPSATDTVDA